MYGTFPPSFITFSATSSILTAPPISNTKISPPFAIVNDIRTSSTACGIVIKNRVTSLSVTVTTPFSTCFLNNGITEPLEFKTFPKRTAENLVCFDFSDFSYTYISQQRLLAPITLIGSTALSVEISTNLSALYFSAKSATFSVPFTLFLTASSGLSSIKGTCLCAAA